MAFELSPLPFSMDALDPYMSTETLEYHYGKHHQGYVTKLNAQVEGTDKATKSLEDIVRNSEGGLFNLAAQSFNHDFFWKSLLKDAPAPNGSLGDAINKKWENLDGFKAAFKAVAGAHFGSGWAWLILKDGELDIVDTHDAGSPIVDVAVRPLLTCDVWEHAYYIDYRNGRPNYLDAFLNHMANWNFAQEQYDAGTR